MSQSENPAISLRLLGPPAVLVNGAALTGLPRKCEALLYLLAISGRSWTRAEVAEMLWDDGDTGGRQNLRVALAKLPGACSEALSREGDRLELVAADHDLSLWRERCKSVHASFADGAAPGVEAELHAHCRALADWPGALLEGFDIDVPQFGDWLYAERQLVQRRWEDAVLALVEWLAARQRWQGPEAALQRLLQLNPGHETAHRWLMQCFIATGRPDAARSQYELCKRQLATLVGAAPSEATRAVLLRAGAAPPAVQPTPPAAEVRVAEPAPPLTAKPPPWLVGRDTEFAELREMLAQPELIRLITLVGAGGMGKTCIARALATAQGARRAHFVELEDQTDPAQLATTIAAALKLEAAGDTPADERLQKHLAQQPTLLVLDNFEQLLGDAVERDGRALVRRLLDACPQLQILVTSREPLHLHDEWIFDLVGLAMPEAVQLFSLRARQVRRDFDADQQAKAIQEICAAVEGMPLAVELAAAALRQTTCAEVMKQLLQGEGPDARAMDLPLRQRNLDNLVDWSWRLLPERLQEVLAAISVLEGSWSEDEGVATSGGTADDLLSLCEKTLLIRDARNAAEQLSRFRLHPLIHRFAAAKLSALTELERQTGLLCSRYYAGELRSLCMAKYSGEQPEITPRLMLLAANARIVLERFLDIAWTQWDDHALTMLMAAWGQWMPVSAVAAWTVRLTDRLLPIKAGSFGATTDTVTRIDAMCARLGAVRCVAMGFAGDYPGAISVASEVIAAYPQQHAAMSECYALRGLCASAPVALQARDDLRAAIDHAQKSPIRYFSASANIDMVWLLLPKFSLVEATAALESAQHDVAGHVELTVYLNLAWARLLLEDGRYREIPDRIESALPNMQGLGVYREMEALGLLAVGLAERGQVDEAFFHIAKAERLGTATDNASYITDLLYRKAIMYWRLSVRGDGRSDLQYAANAESTFREALDHARNLDFWAYENMISLYLSELLSGAKRPAIYREVLSTAYRLRLRHALPWALLGCVLADVDDGRVPDASVLKALAIYGRAELRAPARRLYDALCSGYPTAFAREPMHTAESADMAWDKLAEMSMSYINDRTDDLVHKMVPGHRL